MDHICFRIGCATDLGVSVPKNRLITRLNDRLTIDVEIVLPVVVALSTHISLINASPALIVRLYPRPSVEALFRGDTRSPPQRRFGFERRQPRARVPAGDPAKRQIPEQYANL